MTWSRFSPALCEGRTINSTLGCANSESASCTTLPLLLLLLLLLLLMLVLVLVLVQLLADDEGFVESFVSLSDEAEGNHLKVLVFVQKSQS